MSEMNPIEIQEVSFHRNGISGVGFYAVRFKWQADDNPQPEDFLGIVFDREGECAIIGLDRIESMGVKFAGGNSWRGDHFEPYLRKAIEKNPTSGGVRFGPFCLPTE